MMESYKGGIGRKDINKFKSFCERLGGEYEHGRFLSLSSYICKFKEPTYLGWISMDDKSITISVKQPDRESESNIRGIRFDELEINSTEYYICKDDNKLACFSGKGTINYDGRGKYEFMIDTIEMDRVRGKNKVDLEFYLALDEK